MKPLEETCRDLKPCKKYSPMFNRLLALANERGIHVCTVRFNGKGLRGLWLYYWDKFEITFVDTYRIKGRALLFTLAHELGHSALHKGRINTAAYSAHWEYYMGFERARRKRTKDFEELGR